MEVPRIDRARPGRDDERLSQGTTREEPGRVSRIGVDASSPGVVLPLRNFLVSPGDVQEEREGVRACVDGYNADPLPTVTRSSVTLNC